MSKNHYRISRFTLLITAALFTSALPVRADDKPSLLKNESELGVVIISGNSPTQTYNLKQMTSYFWSGNLLKGNAGFLSSNTRGVETALAWNIGARYERDLFGGVAAFLGQAVEGNRFAGYNQRYITDVGGKYSIYELADFRWSVEAGYRFALENRTDAQVQQHYLRLYTEAERNWSKSFSNKLWVEYLPNLSNTLDHQFNTELSGNAAINDIFAIKVGYLIKFRSILLSPATSNVDTQFTTALVAKF